METKGRKSKAKNTPYVPDGIHLAAQDLDPLNESIMANQATQNIGTLGHVGHGKSTLVQSISGIKTIRFDNELRRNITIKLGYANFKVFECPKCPKPWRYSSGKSSAKPPKCTNEDCREQTKLIRHFSFVDCPGHEVLMATMLNGTTVMDSALFIVAANETVPQPQTAEHLVAAEIMQLKNLLIAQTKLDLVTQERALDNYKQIKSFLRGTAAEDSPIIPLSCTPNSSFNVDVLLQYFVETVPIPKRDFNSPPLMMVVRSFDVNKPGTEIADLKGGIAGGTLKRGILRVGQTIEIRPGIILEDPKRGIRCLPIRTVIKSLFSESNPMQMAVPGGLIAVGTLLDPTLTKGDRLIGQVIGEPGHLPEVYQHLEIQFNLLTRLVGLKEEANVKPEKVPKITEGETLMMNVGATATHGKVLAVKKNVAKVLLRKPCCIEIGENVSLSRNIGGGHRLIGCGKVLHGIAILLEELGSDNNALCRESLGQKKKKKGEPRAQ